MKEGLIDDGCREACIQSDLDSRNNNYTLRPRRPSQTMDGKKSLGPRWGSEREQEYNRRVSQGLMNQCKSQQASVTLCLLLWFLFLCLVLPSFPFSSHLFPLAISERSVLHPPSISFPLLALLQGSSSIFLIWIFLGYK